MATFSVFDTTSHTESVTIFIVNNGVVVNDAISHTEFVAFNIQYGNNDLTTISEFVNIRILSGGVQVYIENSNQSRAIDVSTLQIDNILTSQVDTAKFTIKEYGTRHTFVPEVGEEVMIFNNYQKIFAGLVIKVTQHADDYKVILYDVECQDYTRILDRKLVADVFTNTSIADIITSLRDDYFPDFTLDNVVNADLIVSYIAFNYATISSCLQQLATIVGYDWYVDYDKDLHFFGADEELAPFNLNDSNGSYVFNSLQIRNDNSQLRNRIYVRGGSYLADTFTTQFLSDGVQNLYNLGYTYNDIKVSVTGETMDGGIDGVDADTLFDYMWNTSQNFIRFRGDRIPNTASPIRISGQPYLPVRVVIQDDVSIASTLSVEGYGDGVYEYLIIDNSINSRDAARQRAAAELDSYKETLSEGQFQTYTDGLQAGQTITISSAAYGITDTFIINKVTAKMWTNSKLTYQVSLVTTKTFGIIEFLAGLLSKQTSQIIIDPNEIVDLVYAKTESLSISESLIIGQTHNPQSETIATVDVATSQAVNYAVEFVAGDESTPTGFKRQFILDYSQLA